MTYKKKDDQAELVKTHSYTGKFNFYLYLPTAQVIYTLHIGKQIMKRNIKKEKKETVNRKQEVETKEEISR